MALKALALLSGALARLEVGRVGVASFGTSPRLLHGFDAGDPPSGGPLVSSFSFSQKSTDVRAVLDFALHTLDEARMTNPNAAGELSQLVLVVSDGRLGDREAIQALVREAITKRQVRQWEKEPSTSTRQCER